MMLAFGAGDVFGIVIVGVLLLIGWISEKVKEAQKNAQPPLPRAKPDGQIQGGVSEEERTRRFMEALGLPAEPTAAPGRQKQAEPLRQPVPKPQPKQARRGGTMPPLLGEPWPKPKSRQPPALPPQPQPKAWEEFRSLDSAPAPTAPAGRVTAGSLNVPVVEEFRTLTSSVSAIPSEFPSTGKARRKRGSAPAALPMNRLRQLLAKPESLRTAVVLQEILGAPRGLPNRGDHL